MGTINLVRIDDRLIHGQVMTKWSKGMGTNAIYVPGVLCANHGPFMLLMM